MATRPQGASLIGDISDEALDAAINAEFDGDTEKDTTDDALTGAPELAVSGPSVEDDTPEPAASDTAPAATAVPEPAVAAHPAPAPEAPAASAPAAASEEGTPFSFKATGRDHALPWARERADGSVAITKEGANEFRRILAHERELTTNFRQLQRDSQRQLREAQTARSEKEVQADAVLGLFTDIFRLTPEQRFQYLQEMEGNFPRLQIDLDRRTLAEQQKELERQRTGPKLSEEEQQEQLLDGARTALDEDWTQIRQDAALKDLPEPIARRIFDRYATRPQFLIRQVNDPQEAQQLGVQVGQVIYDGREMRQDMLDALAIHKPATPPAVPAAAAARNAALNADQVKRTTNPIPPAPRAAALSGQPRNGNGQFKKLRPGTKEYREYMMSRSDEDDDE